MRLSFKDILNLLKIKLKSKPAHKFGTGSGREAMDELMS